MLLRHLTMFIGQMQDAQFPATAVPALWAYCLFANKITAGFTPGCTYEAIYGL